MWPDRNDLAEVYDAIVDVFVEHNYTIGEAITFLGMLYSDIGRDQKLRSTREARRKAKKTK